MNMTPAIMAKFGVAAQQGTAHRYCCGVYSASVLANQKVSGMHVHAL
jgi:hypothetical protein